MREFSSIILHNDILEYCNKIFLKKILILIRRDGRFHRTIFKTYIICREVEIILYNREAGMGNLSIRESPEKIG